ncbi:hypothetical protein ABZU94_37150 [Streptomyces mirabilis]|uniref:hypothetical protein n=1 Tax=Streptomyces sp. NPDC005388 TaxID=3156717 RepID=UPI0033B31036
MLPPRRGQDVLSSLARQFLGAPPGVDVAAGFHDVIARARALGPDGTWLVAAGHASLAGMALAGGPGRPPPRRRGGSRLQRLRGASHRPLRPLHHDPRFRALYQRMRITPADLDELFWLHQEMQIMSRDAQNACVDNIGRLDTGVSLLPQAPCRPANRTPAPS